MTNRLYYKLATVAVLLCSCLALINAEEKPVTDICLGCLCEAQTGCNQTSTCQNGVCGLFRLQWGFWVDGGKLTVGSDTPDSEKAYVNCANDPICAANTIQNYMYKFEQDCDGNNVIDCYDYAKIHKLGPYGCTGEVPYEYYNTLKSCLEQFS